MLQKKEAIYTEMSLWRQRNEEVLASGISLGKRETQLCVQTAVKSITSLSTVAMCSRKSKDREGTATIGHTHTLSMLHGVNSIPSHKYQEQTVSPGAMLYARYQTSLIPVLTELAV